MVISATYTANLAAFLTVERLDTGNVTTGMQESKEYVFMDTGKVLKIKYCCVTCNVVTGRVESL